MWFGDLVTMRWWDDLWLNESFATWASVLAEAEATRWGNAWTTFCQLQKAWAYQQDQLPSTHPIAADIPDIAAVEVNFDGITYAKGASVLKQLVAYVGREQFLAGVRQLLRPARLGQRDAGRPARPRWSRPPAATWPPGPRRGWRPPGSTRCGRSSCWTATAGSPRSPCSRSAAGQPPGAAPAPHRDRPVRPDRGRAGPAAPGRGGHRRRAHRAARAGRRAPARPGAGQRRRPDLRQDPAGRRTRCARWSSASASSPSSLPAALCWAAAWDMCRDAELAARDYIGHGHRPARDTISGIAVLQTLLRQAAAAARRFTDPAWRADGLGGPMAAGLRGLAEQAEPGLGPAAGLPAGVRRRGDPAGRSGPAGRPAGRVRARWTAWRWTPSCAGGCCTGWSARARRARPRSTRSWTGTRPTRVSGAPPPAGPRSR